MGAASPLKYPFTYFYSTMGEQGGRGSVVCAQAGSLGCQK